MEIHFAEPDQVPQPRDKVRIERLTAQPYPDGWRIKLNVDVTPFQERPNLELRVLRLPEERVIAELSIIETMHRKMEFTVHVRGVATPNGDYLAQADLYYEERTAPQDRREVPFSIQV
ncbi:MAG: hypothetical protein J7551_04135 [Chloroflexi bacterium]|jgi:hypothetical protein|nr:hypothetical protein [Chloroflexota bacterium]